MRMPFLLLTALERSHKGDGVVGPAVLSIVVPSLSTDSSDKRQVASLSVPGDFQRAQVRPQVGLRRSSTLHSMCIVAFYYTDAERVLIDVMIQ